MIIYWTLFIIPAIFSLIEKPNFQSRNLTFSVSAFYIFLVLVIGLRHEVGADWDLYFLNYKVLIEVGLNGVFSSLNSLVTSPGYQLLCFISEWLGFGIHGANFLGAIIFSLGLYRLCSNLPRPWLGLAIAVPYIVIVTSMGYTRQGMALGFVMMAYPFLLKGNNLRFILYLFIGATFHPTVLFLLFLPAFLKTTNRLLMIFLITGFSITIYLFLLASILEGMFDNYLGSEMGSSGAYIRVFLNAAAGIIFLFFGRNFFINSYERSALTILSWTSVLFIFALFLSPSSTAVDRLAIYISPLQILIFSRVPEIFGSYKKQNIFEITSVLIIFFAVNFIWLNYALHAFHWFPYQNILFK
jgi:hypothetical protein